MKKIISIFCLLFFFVGTISLADTSTQAGCTAEWRSRNASSQSCCAAWDTYIIATKSCLPTANNSASGSINWITINEKCLTNGQCKFNIYDTLGIRKSVGGDASVGLFVQDIVLSATFFIWTIVTVALIVSGLMYIFAAASGKDPKNAKSWIIGALIGLVIVACSYFIIRLIQYLAKGV